MISPLAIFAFNRPKYLEKCLKSLKLNKLSRQTITYFFIDYPKLEKDFKNYHKVLNMVRETNIFKKKVIIQRKYNYGLKKNILNGINYVLKKNETIIVLEDDLYLSKYFLDYMNKYLYFFKNSKNIASIHGYCYPIDKKNLNNFFLLRGADCWGWATWSDRWEYFEKNIDKTMKDFSRKQIKYFNLDNYENYWSQIIANKENKINTWAVFWYATIIKHKGLCLNPAHSFVINIGNDGSGEHRDSSNTFLTTLSKTNKFNFTSDFQENLIAVDLIKKFYKSIKTPLLTRITNKFKRMLNKTIKSLS